MDDEPSMPALGTTETFLVAAGGLVMTYLLLSAIGRSAIAAASDMVLDRRAQELRQREADAAAEAAGRAAALEPLALNADGSVEEPILGIVEQPV